MIDSQLELLDRIPIPIFVLELSNDGDVTYTFLNQIALSVAKFNLGDYVGCNAKQLYHGEFGVIAYDKHVECFQTAEPITYELMLPINGKLRSIRTNLMPIMDSDGLVVRVIGASTEITAESELEQMRGDSRVLQQELQEFIYLAAHDLRSPMKKVNMFADMLREDLEELGYEKLDLIDLLEKVSVESMSMIQKMLNHAEISAMEESIEHVHLPGAVAGIQAMLDPEKLHVCQVDDDTVHGDGVLIQTILRNLIDNSMKHNAPASTTLTVTAGSSKAGYFTMNISDNGQGMEKPEKLFKSIENDRSRSGFGLLAIRKLIKRAGGDIAADHCTDGPGLSVTVTLPGSIK